MRKARMITDMVTTSMLPMSIKAENYAYIFHLF